MLGSYVMNNDNYINWLDVNMKCGLNKVLPISCKPNKVIAYTNVIELFKENESNLWTGYITFVHSLNQPPMTLTNTILQLQIINNEPIVKFNTKWYASTIAPDQIPVINTIATLNEPYTTTPYIILYTDGDSIKPHIVAKLSSFFGNFTNSPSSPSENTKFEPSPKILEGGAPTPKYLRCGTTKIKTPDGKIRALYKKGNKHYIKQKIDNKMQYTLVKR